MALRCGLAVLILLGSTDPAFTQDSLRILSWNIQMLPSLVHGNGKAKRAKAIVQQLQQQTYDVVVFQEAFKHRSRRIITEGLEHQYPYRTKVLNKKSIALKTNGGVILFSQHPITEFHEIRYTKRTGFDRFTRKGALLAEIDYRGNTIQVIGTHLQAFAANEILYSQYHQLHDELLKPFAKKGVPQFVCGDFNTQKTSNLPAGISAEGSVPQTRYQYLLQTLGAHDGELTGTQQFTMDRPYNDLCVKRKEARLLLDYILVRGGEEDSLSILRKVKIMRQPWSKEHVDLSDHFGVEAIVCGLNRY